MSTESAKLDWRETAGEIQKVVDGFFLMKEEVRKLKDGFAYQPMIQPTIDVTAFIDREIKAARLETLKEAKKALWMGMTASPHGVGIATDIIDSLIEKHDS